METLIENFGRNVIRVYKSKYTVIYGNRGKHLHFDKTEKIPCLTPDLILREDNENRLVIECKYKKTQLLPKVDDADKVKPMLSDIYQMVSYMRGTNCPRGVLVYPKDECEEVEISIAVEGKTYTVFVKQIDYTNYDEDQLKCLLNKSMNN
jgi:5-methylcytosine-specific restriction endonuclease McrBC regulatory subunit McrC